jgi:hypothetical protein
MAPMHVCEGLLACYVLGDSNGFLLGETCAPKAGEVRALHRESQEQNSHHSKHDKHTRRCAGRGIQ